jgi:transcription elongation factor Elf1
VLVARRQGVPLPDDAVLWPGKRLLRRAQAREEEARVRRNPIRVDEGFLCGHCGAEVGSGGRVVRDHCDRCLSGLHVDVVPGDRAASCRSRLQPVGLEILAGVAVLKFTCVGCGHTLRGRAHPSDDPAALVALSARKMP